MSNDLAQRLLLRVCIVSVLASAAARAEVVFDGSVGPEGSLSGNMEISEDFGTRSGTNLFHSFTIFNVNPGESATFTSTFAGATDNVIARVTGSFGSLIDGPLTSAIPNSSLWLINPNGFVFGEGAAIDVQGTFTATTADYVLLDDGGRFAADLGDAAGTILTMGNPTTFGFLGPAAPIALDGSSLTANGGLTLVGGDVTLSQSSIDTAGDGGGDVYIEGGQILIDGSRINTSTSGAGDAGDVTLRADGQVWIGGVTPDGLPSNIVTATAGAGSGGDILIEAADVRIDDGAYFWTVNDDGEPWVVTDLGDSGSVTINASGNVTLAGTNENSDIWVARSSAIVTTAFDNGDAGAVNINAGSFTMDDASVIWTNSYEGGDSGPVNITATGAVTLGGLWDTGFGFSTGGVIFASTWGPGDGADVTIQAADLVMKDEFTIILDAFVTGQAGSVFIDVDNFSLLDWSRIAASNFENTLAADIVINASDTILLDSGIIEGTTNWGAEGGDIIMNARVIEILNSGHVSTNSFLTDLPGGSIFMTATESITLRNDAFVTATSTDVGARGGDITIVTPLLELFEFSGISTNTFDAGVGAGDIHVMVDDLTMNSSSIQAEACSCASGDAGNIVVEASGTISISGLDRNENVAGIRSRTFGAGRGGSIEVAADEIYIFDQGGIRSESTATQQDFIDEGLPELSPGPAGSIDVTANYLEITNGGVISTTAVEAAGGNIRLNVADALYVNGGSITAEAQGVTPEDDGGNVTVSRPDILILNDAEVRANANAGNGGNISLAAEVLVPSAYSVIDASSQAGLDGNVVLDSPNQTVTGVAALEAPSFDVSDLIQDPCDIEVLRERSSFTIEGDGGVPPAPDEFITAPPPRVEGADLSARLSPTVAATPRACEVSER